MTKKSSVKYYCYDIKHLQEVSVNSAERIVGLYNFTWFCALEILFFITYLKANIHLQKICLTI